MSKTKICVIGSGAGAGPVIYELANAGYNVVILEKGPWIKTKDFSKDEIGTTRRDSFTPLLKEEPYTIDYETYNGDWQPKSNAIAGQNFWNGSLVGGSSNFMSGYFHRMKPNDFKLKTTYGNIPDSNIVDWPINYQTLEPYYDKVEKIVGISGKVVNHKFLEPRSSKDFPFPALRENYVASMLDKAASEMDIEIIPNPRAIISKKKDDRNPCYLSNFCGSYACSSDAKSSSRVALINDAVKKDNCRMITNAKVFHLETNGKGKIVKAHYHTNDGDKFIEADLFIVAAQAIETSRLLLLSKNIDFPNGLANNNNQVGKNLVFSAGGIGSGIITYNDYSKEISNKINEQGSFINRSIHQFYEVDYKGKKVKGGVVDFLFEHANPVGKAMRNKWDYDGNLVYGEELQKKLKNYFTEQRKIKFEIFVDWQPNDNCFMELDKSQKDKYGDLVPKLRLQNNDYDKEIGKLLATESKKVLKQMGCTLIYSSIGSAPPANLQAGGCRFGNDPKTSVLDANCKAHDVDNLYVTDGSSFPTGGSVPFTWTIYANSFRVADIILKRLDDELI